MFTFEFVNAEDRANTYRVEIQDPDSAQLGHSELVLIKQSMEWRYFCELKYEV